MYNKKRIKGKTFMGKKNEVNGVLVYRRWCVGAILSTIILLFVIAMPALLVAFKWVAFEIPGGSSVSSSLAGQKIEMVALDLFRPIFKKGDYPIQQLLNDITASTEVKYFKLISTYMLYGLFGFVCFIGLFVLIEAIYAFFYIITGRVVNPAGPVKIAWVIFVLMLLFAAATFGFYFFIDNAYFSASGKTEHLVFDLKSIPFNDLLNGNMGWLWPIAFTVGSLLFAIILSIIYTAAFKDKFFIGRARKFGSGETDTVTTQRTETTHIITTGGTTTTVPPATGQPQVIVVNSTPAQAPYIIPGQQQPVIQVVQPQQQGQVVQPAEQGDVVATPGAVLPSDIKSIGGHAFAKNLDLRYADIPTGIKELGVGAFANCLNLEVVCIPKSVKRIKKNCFFNCVKLARINYAGTKSEWRYIVRGSNWLERAGTKTVVCSDGAIIVDPHR